MTNFSCFGKLRLKALSPQPSIGPVCITMNIKLIQLFLFILNSSCNNHQGETQTFVKQTQYLSITWDQSLPSH